MKGRKEYVEGGSKEGWMGRKEWMGWNEFGRGAAARKVGRMEEGRIDGKEEGEKKEQKKDGVYKGGMEVRKVDPVIIFPTWTKQMMGMCKVLMTASQQFFFFFFAATSWFHASFFLQ